MKDSAKAAKQRLTVEQNQALRQELAQVRRELAAKEAAINVLMGENDKLKEDLRVAKEHIERYSYMMAEAGK